jgi:hypothetical protein
MEKLGEGDWGDDIEKELGDALAEAIDDFGPDFDEEGNPIEEGESDRIMSEEERRKGSHVGEGISAEEQAAEEGGDDESSDEDSEDSDEGSEDSGEDSGEGSEDSDEEEKG